MQQVAAPRETPCAHHKGIAPSCHSQSHQCPGMGGLQRNPALRLPLRKFCLPSVGPVVPEATCGPQQEHRVGVEVKREREEGMRSYIPPNWRELQIPPVSVQLPGRGLFRGHLGKPPRDKWNVRHVILSKEATWVLQPAVKCSAAKISTNYDRRKMEKASEVSFYWLESLCFLSYYLSS